MPESNTDSRTVAEVGEFGVIDRATHGRRQPATTILGPGDDAAVVAAANGDVVVTTDMLVQNRHFRLDWSSPYQLGRKAIAQNGADIAAMGARSTAFVVALGCPASTPIMWTDGLTEGLWAEAARIGAGIVGGDLVQSRDLVISVTALGDLEGRRPVLRSGARPGDVVAVCGRLGAAAAGYAVLRSGESGFVALADAHRVPTPPYEQGPLAAAAGATAMTDISDGLLADLGHIAEASGVRLDVTSAELQLDSEISSAANYLGIDPVEWLLTGGEDHALAATFPGNVTLLPGWTRIGSVMDGSEVTVDGDRWKKRSGWESFQD